MKNYILDTIIAQATPVGYGGVCILRISGSRVIDISKEVFGKLLKPRYANYSKFYDKFGDVLDYGIAIFFPSPNSFTGEHVLEFQCHGGYIIVDLLIKRLLEFDNVRIANPGEFLQRAFLNGKLNLSQAESISDIINANSEISARLAVKSANGALSKIINKIERKLVKLRARIELFINFSDDIINSYEKDIINSQLNDVISNVISLHKEAKDSLLMKNIVNIVIAGPPNAGKSTLFNILSKNDNSIVTNIAGTTRDVLKENIFIKNVQFCIMDTAGLFNYSDKINKIAVSKSRSVIENADHVLFVIDSLIYKDINYKQLFLEFFPKNFNRLSVSIVKNKSDISNEKIQRMLIDGTNVICISAKKNKGIDILKNYLIEIYKSCRNLNVSFLSQHRHIHILNLSKKHLRNAKYFLSIEAYDLLAEEVHLSHLKLSEIVGYNVSEKTLDEIFSSFCIGK